MEIGFLEMFMNNNQINLSVPYYCQRDNKYIWYMRDKNGIKDISTKKVLAPITCNVTSLCMILHYFGITQDSPDDMLYKIFDSAEFKDDSKFATWRTTAYPAEDKCPGDLEERANMKHVAHVLYGLEKDTFKYTIQNAFDKNPATSYVEDTDDDLFSIRFVFAKELFFQNYSRVIGKSLSINNISVINGYAANENLYFSNNRIKELIISSYNLENKKKSDNFLKELSKIYTGILKDNNLSFSTIQIPKEKIYSVTFSCTQLYKGKKYNDTCLAEFDLYNKNVGWLFGGVN